jgi:DNA-binding PucR family transcriptional regulator
LFVDIGPDFVPGPERQGLKPTDIGALFEGLASSPDLRPFCELIEVLKVHDRKHNSDLVRTIEVFFATNANASETADRLFLHRNSIPYRLERVRELTGLDLRDHRARLALQLGLLASSDGRRKNREAEHP